MKQGLQRGDFIDLILIICLNKKILLMRDVKENKLYKE